MNNNVASTKWVAFTLIWGIFLCLMLWWLHLKRKHIDAGKILRSSIEFRAANFYLKHSPPLVLSWNLINNFLHDVIAYTFDGAKTGNLIDYVIKITNKIWKGFPLWSTKLTYKNCRTAHESFSILLCSLHSLIGV